jgi:hypothetical protein
MSWDIYQTAYQATDDSTRELVDSDTIPKCVETVIVGQGLNPVYQRVLVQQATYCILNVHTTEQAEVELKKASVPDALRILSTILNCAGRPVKPEQEKVISSTQPVSNTPPILTTHSPQSSNTSNVGNPTPTAPPPAQPAPPPPTTPTPGPQAVPKVRTMQNDMQVQNQSTHSNEPIYSSTQEAILKESSVQPKNNPPS